MIIIFAKLGTTEKVLTNLSHISLVSIVQKLLNETKGGEWLKVDELNQFEYIEFKDNNVYKGFSPNKDRYFDVNIITQ